MARLGRVADGAPLLLALGHAAPLSADEPQPRAPGGRAVAKLRPALLHCLADGELTVGRALLIAVARLSAAANAASLAFAVRAVRHPLQGGDRGGRGAGRGCRRAGGVPGGFRGRDGRRQYLARGVPAAVAREHRGAEAAVAAARLRSGGFFGQRARGRAVVAVGGRHADPAGRVPDEPAEKHPRGVGDAGPWRSRRRMRAAPDRDLHRGAQRNRADDGRVVSAAERHRVSQRRERPRR